MTESILESCPWPRRYLCERCGGTKLQPAGCWDSIDRKYNSKAGKCELCDGVGYLGLIITSKLQSDI